MMRSLSAKLSRWNKPAIPVFSGFRSVRPVIFPAFLFLIFSLISFISCKKDPYTLGFSLLPPTDTLTAVSSDTATIIAYSVIQDSIRTDKTATNMLGSLYDPIFGITTASFCTQVLLSTEDVNFGDRPVLDSVVLMLRYSGVYGDSTALQRVKVFELNEDISLDSVYYSNHKVNYYNTLLADYTFKPNFKDSIPIYGTNVPAHLRINLSKRTNYFGNKILYAPPDALLSNNGFIKFIKGLYIESSPVSSGGAILSFNMSSNLTNLIIYYHHEDGEDSLGYSFILNQYAARINTFDHNNYNEALPEVRNQLLNNDTAGGKQLLYLQGLAGTKVKIRLPYILDYGKSQKIAINNAVLILKNFETDTTLSPPPQLYIVQEDSTGQLYYLFDYQEGTAFAGGTYHASDRSYRFRITRHLQKLVLDEAPNNDLYLLINNPSKSALDPTRLVGVGTEGQPPSISSDKLQLQIIYTKIY